MKKLFTHQLSIIILTLFLDSLGFGILIPIVPLLFADPTSPFYMLSGAVSVQTGYIFLGLLTAIFPMMQLFSTAILGQLSDKFGRRPVLLYTLFVTATSYALFAIGIALKNIPLLFISRAMAGIASGNLSVAQASIADITEPQNRAKNFGLIGAAFGIGFIIGPFLGGKLSDHTLLPFLNPTVPFIFAAILSLINALSVKMNFKETNKFIKKETAMVWGKAFNNIQKAFKLHHIRFLFLVNFLFFSGFTFFVTFFSVFLIKQFHYTQGNIGDIFAFIGLWISFTQGFLTRKVAKFLNEQQVLRFTIIGDGIFIGLLYFTPAPWVLYCILPFVAIFNGLSFANMLGLISRSADAKIQGEILGINASVQALAQLIPPILSGFIAATFTPEVPLLVASGLIIFAGSLFAILYKPTTSPEQIKSY